MFVICTCLWVCGRACIVSSVPHIILVFQSEHTLTVKLKTACTEVWVCTHMHVHSRTWYSQSHKLTYTHAQVKTCWMRFCVFMCVCACCSSIQVVNMLFIQVQLCQHISKVHLHHNPVMRRDFFFYIYIKKSYFFLKWCFFSSFFWISAQVFTVALFSFFFETSIKNVFRIVFLFVFTYFSYFYEWTTELVAVV